MLTSLKESIARLNIRLLNYNGDKLVKLGQLLEDSHPRLAFTLKSAGLPLINPSFHAYLFDHYMRTPVLIFSKQRLKEKMGCVATGMVEGYALGSMSDQFCCRQEGVLYRDNDSRVNNLKENPVFRHIMAWAPSLRVPFEQYYNSMEAIFELADLNQERARFTVGPEGIEDTDLEHTRATIKAMTGMKQKLGME